MLYLPYRLPSIPWSETVKYVAAAEDAVARVDERVGRSGIRDGWISRSHYLEAQAILGLEGELVILEDLVLHDAHMDIRTPTHELTTAHTILRARRRLAHQDTVTLSEDFINELAGRGGAADNVALADDASIFPDDDDDGDEGRACAEPHLRPRPISHP
jgi:hypothetical protein